MTMIYDPPTYTDSGQTPPGSPWHGPAGPGGPGGPYGYGGGGDGRHPVRRWRHRFALATVAVVAGLGSFFAVLAATAPSRSVVLTTAQIAAQTDPGLVDIVSNLGLQQAESAGTGLVLTPSGEILTNNHVIKGATAIRVTDIGNGHTYPAKVVGYDQSRDIAVIQLVGASGLQTAALGNSSTAQVGNKVVALGNAGGKGGTPSVAVGRVAGLNASIMASDAGAGTVERLTGLIHHTAPIQPGDSGGPLINGNGQVIGMDTAASGGRRGPQPGAVESFAIPINTALNYAHQLLAHPAAPPSGAYLGVCPQDDTTQAGALIVAGCGLATGVASGSPAAAAGLTAGDVIIELGGNAVSSRASLALLLQGDRAGQSVSLVWLDRGGGRHQATVDLAAGTQQ